MLIYASQWQEKPSFRLVPLTQDCPFNEVIYDPSSKVLVIISKDAIDKPQMLPKVDDRGDLVRKRTGEIIQERRILKSYYEYYIDNVEDINHFINNIAVNPTHEALNILLSIDDVLDTEPDKTV